MKSISVRANKKSFEKRPNSITFLTLELQDTISLQYYY